MKTMANNCTLKMTASFYFYYNVPDNCAPITLRKSKCSTQKYPSLAYFQVALLKYCRHRKTQSRHFAKRNAHLINSQWYSHLIFLSVWKDIVTGGIDFRSDSWSRW